MRRGLPLALYTDRHGVFQAPPGPAGRRPPTQFARALGQLGITQVFARSPQAKGRLERFAGALQDRLVTEWRNAGAAAIAEAQAVLDDFLPRSGPASGSNRRNPSRPTAHSTRRSTWAPSSPSATPARSRGTTRSSTAGARCNSFRGPSEPATPAPESRWSNERTARSRSVTTARRSPRAWPLPRPGCCARPAPNWLAVPTTSGSSRAAAPAERYPGLPTLPARTVLQSTRHATEPLLNQLPTAVHRGRRRPANSPAGGRSSRPSCKASRCR